MVSNGFRPDILTHHFAGFARMALSEEANMPCARAGMSVELSFQWPKQVRFSTTYCWLVFGFVPIIKELAALVFIQFTRTEEIMT